MSITKIKILFFFVVLFLAGAFAANAQANQVGAEADAGTLTATQESGNNRVAPGEFLPVSIKLVNFGSQKRVDVIVNYTVLDSKDTVVYTESETVAVETTASFVKRIQLPYDLKTGSYVMVSSLTYPDQQQPAESRFVFKVEEKIGSFFKTDLIFYAISVLSILLAAVIITYTFTVVSRKHNVLVHDYTDKPKGEIIYYEILSDVISQKRLRIGDDALEIAKDIPDLEINEKNGLVINIKKNPAKIVALLIDRYEEATGSRVSFSLPQKTHN